MRSALQISLGWIREVSDTAPLGSMTKALIGTDEANIDDKGRILIGKKKRDRLGDGFAMCLGDNGAIFAYPAWKWEEIVAETLRYDPINQGRQDYTRMMMGTAEDEIDFDQQGRVVVPRKLRDMAKLRDRVLLIGCGDRMEIWAEEEYRRYEEDRTGYSRERRESMQRASKEMKSE